MIAPAKHLTPAEQGAILTLPLLSTQVLLSLLHQLYAEPGFSDVDVKDIARTLEIDLKSVKGAIGHLTKAGLVTPMMMEVNGKDLYLMYTPLHQDYAGRDGDATKAEAIEWLEARLAFLNEAIAPSNGGKSRFYSLAEAEAFPMPGVPVQVVSPVTEVKRPLRRATVQVEPSHHTQVHTVRVGPAVLQVLNGHEGLAFYNTVVTKETKGYVELRINGTGLKSLLSSLDSRARGVADGWDQPLWFAASAHAAAKAIRKQVGL